MSTAYFYSGADKRIGSGTYNYTFNPTGDVLGATVEEVRYRFFIDYNNGAAVDLGDVDIWMNAPGGRRINIYDNWDGWGNDTDDGNDSDGANDYDISFWGTDSKSDISTFMDGVGVNGTWTLEIRNNTGKTLDLSFLEVWVDYSKPTDYAVTDINIIGTQQVDQPVLIEATIENVGDKYTLEYVTIEYLVNGQVIGTSALPTGLLPGVTNVETELHSFDLIGANDVTVRIAGSPDLTTSNNSRTETFIFEHNQADLAVTDIRVTGSMEAGGLHYITADVSNVGNATHYGDVLLHYFIDGEYIGEQTIGLAGANIMLTGTTNSETEAHFISDPGNVDITVEIVNPDIDDWDDGNDARTESFSFAVPDTAPDLDITDVRVIGGWRAGDEVNLRAHIENNGNGLWNALAGFPEITYSVRYQSDMDQGNYAWTEIGTDGITAALVPTFSEWEDITFTQAKDGAFEVKVEIAGDDYEPNRANNVWTEEAGHSRETAPQKTLANSADDVALGTFMARAVYGMEDIPNGPAPTDYHGSLGNGLGDNYRAYLDTIGFRVLDDSDFGELFRPKDELAQFFSGGLYAGDTGLTLSILPEFWQAQGLVAVGEDATGARTLTLTFRGTDGYDILESLFGQAYTGNGLYDYYESMRPLIDAALAYANDASNGIEKMVVSGHSLGGATADAFAYVDAHRLNSDIDLTVVSLASAGLNPAFLEDTAFSKGMDGQYDESAAWDGTNLVAPSFYIGLSHAIDAVTFPENNLLAPIKIPNATLLGNENLDNGLISIETPNMSNYHMSGFNFGAGHNSGLYWANIAHLTADSLVEHYVDQQIIMGLTDYSQIPDLNGETISLFKGYDLHQENPDAPSGSENYDNDQGPKTFLGLEVPEDFQDVVGYKTLSGGGADEFILGMSGNDRIEANGGDDLISGGTGNDTILSGSGNDHATGGDGNELIFGGSGDDTIEGGAGNDILRGMSGNDSLLGDDGQDTIFANTGADHVMGGNGDDVAYGGDGADILEGDAGNDLLDAGSGMDSVEGGLGNDTLVGGLDGDTLSGGDGMDVLRGEGGNDLLLGGLGDDTGYGASGNDTLNGGEGNDLLEGGAQSDLISGDAGADTLRGEDGYDTLTGGAGDDLLVGGNGLDVLQGDIGQDTLRGDAGGDTFVFTDTDESAYGAADLIDGIDGIGLAFGDIIDLSAIDANETLIGDEAFVFIGNATNAAGLSAGAGTLWLRDNGTNTQIFGNTDGDNIIDLAILVADGAVLASDYLASDFVL